MSASKLVAERHAARIARIRRAIDTSDAAKYVVEKNPGPPKRKAKRGTTRPRARGATGVRAVPQRQVVSGVHQALPDVMTVTLSWEFEGTVSFTADTVTDFVYSQNNAFDPGSALAATQPMYFDQWAALYERYEVMDCSTRFMLYPTQFRGVSGTTGTDVGPAPVCHIVLSLGDSSGAFTDMKQAFQVGYTETWTTPTRMGVVNNRQSTAKASGRPWADYTQAVTTTGPSEEHFWHATVLPSFTFNGVRFTIRLEQVIRFYDRRVQSDALGMLKRLIANMEAFNRRCLEKKMPPAYDIPSVVNAACSDRPETPPVLVEPVESKAGWFSGGSSRSNDKQVTLGGGLSLSTPSSKALSGPPGKR